MTLNLTFQGHSRSNVMSLDSPYMVSYWHTVITNHMPNSHHLALIATQTVFPYLLCTWITTHESQISLSFALRLLIFHILSLIGIMTIASRTLREHPELGKMPVGNMSCRFSHRFHLNRCVSHGSHSDKEWSAADKLDFGVPQRAPKPTSTKMEMQWGVVNLAHTGHSSMQGAGWWHRCLCVTSAFFTTEAAYMQSDDGNRPGSLSGCDTVSVLWGNMANRL